MNVMSKLSEDRILLSGTLKGGAMWSRVIPRGCVLRLTDVEGGANVSAVCYNADQPLERYNMPDTLKAQHTAFLTRGYALYSDMGRILFSMIDDTCGWHDTQCGHSNAASVAAKYGSGTYQEKRNDFFRNARDNFLIELGKWGLGKRDLVPNLNFFSKVVTDDQGNLNWVPGHSAAGDYVDLRAEMNVLMVLNTCQHPLDPETTYQSKPVQWTVYQGDPPEPDDPCRTSRPENGRGFTNTEALFTCCRS